MSVHDHKIEISNKQIRHVTNIGIVCNVLLSAIKFMFGVLGNSIALVADGFHSLSDVATDFAVLVGVRMSSKAPDEEHPYGHGSFEPIGTIVIGIILIIVAALLAIENIQAFRSNKVFEIPEWPTLLIAFISIFAKGFVYRLTL